MGRPIRSLAFAALIVTTAARVAAQSHGKEPVAKPGVAHETPAPAAKAGAAAPPRGKQPVPAKPGVSHEAPAPPAAKPGAAAPPHGKQPVPVKESVPVTERVPVKPDVSHETPAPAATARAIARALTDSRARRKDVPAPQHDVAPVPVERRRLVVWPEPNGRVTLTWPEQRVALMWPTADERR